MKRSVTGAIVAGVTAAIVSALVVSFLRDGHSRQTSREDVGARASSSSSSPAAGAAQSDKPENIDTQLTERLKTLCSGAGGDVGVAVIHVETGRKAQFDGSKPLPLYSVFKLPLAVTVLKDVEEKQISLDKKVHVTPDDV